MPDVALPWNTDFTLTDSGDLLLCDDLELSTERVIRRLLTAPGAYVWHSTYGAGVAAFVGLSKTAAQVVKAIRAQIFQESTVARQPIPQITVEQDIGTISPTISYNVATGGGPTTLTFDVTNPNNTTGQ